MAKPGVGQSKAALAARKAANKGVKAGTVRKGAAGKYDRKWNAKTARWEIVGARKSTTAKYVAGVKKSAAKNPARSKPGMTTAQYAASKDKSTTPSHLRGLAAGKPTSASRVTPSARGEGGMTNKKDKGPRRANESIGAYNDRIRNAPLRDFFANLGSSGKSRTDEKSAARNQAAYMSGKPSTRPQPMTAAQKAAKAKAEKEYLAKQKAAARAQALRASGR